MAENQLPTSNCMGKHGEEMEHHGSCARTVLTTLIKWYLPTRSQLVLVGRIDCGHQILGENKQVVEVESPITVKWTLE